MKSSLKKLSLLVISFLTFPMATLAHGIGDHSHVDGGFHSVLGFEHILLAATLGLILYAVIKRLI